MLMEVLQHGPCPPKRQESQSAWCPGRMMKWGSRCPKHESESGSLEDFLQWIWSSHCLVDIIKFEWTLIHSQQKASPTYSCENFWHKFFFKAPNHCVCRDTTTAPPQHHTNFSRQHASESRLTGDPLCRGVVTFTSSMENSKI